MVITGRSQGTGIGLELGHSGNSGGCGLVMLHGHWLPRSLRQGLPRLRKGWGAGKHGAKKAQPAFSPVRAHHNTGRGALQQGCWRNEGRHCGGRHEEGRVALLELVLQGPPLRHGSHLLSQQNSPFRPKALCSFQSSSTGLCAASDQVPWYFLGLHKVPPCLNLSSAHKERSGQHTR